MTPQIGKPLRKATFIVTLFVLCSAAFFSHMLLTEIRHKVDELSVDRSHTAHWSLAQADVELIALLLEIQTAIHSPGSDLQALRLRHDIYYGRVGIMNENADFFATVKGRAFLDELKPLNDYIEEFTPLIDGDDEGLRAALPRMLEAASALRQVQSDVTAIAQDARAQMHDLRRISTGDTLRVLGGFALALLAAHIILIAVLAHQVRKARWNSMQQTLAQARLKSIIVASLDAILVVDGDGLVTECNPAAEQLFGCERDELVGRPILERITEAPEEAIPDEDLLQARPNYRRVYGWRLDGTTFPAEYTIASTSTSGDTVKVCFLHDISQRLEAERALIQARDRALAGEKAKADMLSVMSHEMRTPLNGILGTIELMGDTRLTKRQKDYLQIVENSGQQLLSHVNDLLDVARFDAGKLPVKYRAFDINALMEDIRAHQTPQALARSNALYLELLEAESALVWGDAQRLRQVLLNLVSNAIKFTKEGEISIALRRLSGDRIQIDVADTGIGIGPDDIERVFEEFVTLDTTYGRASEGTGLGLAISRRMVQAMGGEISVKSTPGSGSLFQVTLTLASAQAEDLAIETAASVAAYGQPLRALVVEDNPVNRFVLRAMLEGDGHSVTEASNGAEGLRLSREKPYDVIFMDIAMPELDGVATTAAIRNNEGPNCETAIVALTAHVFPEDLERFKVAGVTRTLTKPLTRDGLRYVLLHAVDPTEASTRPEPGELIDLVQLESLERTLGTSSCHGLMHRYIADTEAELAILHNGPSSLERSGQIAHLLAGSAALFGAAALREVLVDLEQAATDAQTSEVERLTAVALTVWAQTRAALETLERVPEPAA